MTFLHTPQKAALLMLLSAVGGRRLARAMCSRARSRRENKASSREAFPWEGSDNIAVILSLQNLRRIEH